MFIASALGGNYISSPRNSIKAIVIPAASCDHYITMRALALQLPFVGLSESMGNHDSNIEDAGSVD
jgi:hypothetical protein